jgi:hypothetical protein
MQSKISFLLPLFAVGATLLAKMIWRAFQVVKPGTFIVQTPYNYLNIQNHTEVEGLKCYLQTLITAYAHNLEVNSSKQYQYHCCLIDAKLLLWCTYLGALLLMGSKFFQWNFSLSFHWILIALFCTFAVFADCIKTHWTNFWTHHDSQLKES